MLESVQNGHNSQKVLLRFVKRNYAIQFVVDQIKETAEEYPIENAPCKRNPPVGASQLTISPMQ